MENMDKFSFPKPPSPDTMTLLDLCFRAVAKDFSKYDHDALIADLPVHLVDQFKSYMTPRMLHNIMPFLEKKGIDTSYDWETFAIQDRYAILLEDKTFDIDSDRKSKKGGHPKDAFLVTERNVNEFHHAYISEHCEKLLYNLFQLKQGNNPYEFTRQKMSTVPTEKDIREDLLRFLSSVISIKISLDIFRKLLLEQEIMNALIENLESLTIKDIGFFAGEDPARLTVAAAERISRILRGFCRSKVLKSINFECGLCYDEWEWDRDNVSIILKGLDVSGPDEIEHTEEVSEHTLSSFEDDIEPYDEGEPYWMDKKKAKLAMEKIHKEDESWVDFQEISKAIDQAVENTKTSNTGDQAAATQALESVSLCINCFLHVGDYLPNWKTVRRLSFEGSLVGNAPSGGLARDILTRIACHQLTHLKMSKIKCNNLVQRVLYIFHEYYKSEPDGNKRPMEMLDLSFHDDKGKEDFPVFEGTDKVYAVKHFMGPCVKLDEHFTAYLTFFKNNASLTHLEMGFRHSQVISCVRILDCLSESNVLETLALKGKPVTYKDEINKADSLVIFLNNVKTLKKLQLNTCCVEGDTVSNPDLTNAIRKHGNLKTLHFGDNDMGPAGAEFLTALLMPVDGVTLELEELDLNACNIPAEDLLVAARTLKKSTVHRPLIDTLNIENYVFKGGDDDAEIAMENKMKTEFEELVKSVSADFYDYNPFDPDSSHYVDYDQLRYNSDQNEPGVNGEDNDVNGEDNDAKRDENDVNGLNNDISCEENADSSE